MSTLMLFTVAIVVGLVMIFMAARNRRRSDPVAVGNSLKKDLSALISQVANERNSFEKLLQEAEDSVETLKTSIHEFKSIEAAIDRYKEELRKMEKTLSDAVVEAKKGVDSFLNAASEAKNQIDNYCKAILAEKSKFLLRSTAVVAKPEQFRQDENHTSQKFDIQVEKVVRRPAKNDSRQDVLRSDPRLGVLGVRA